MSERRGSGSRLVNGRTIGAAIIAVVALAFVFQNTEQVHFDLFFLHFNAHLWLVLVIIFALGWLVGSLVRWRGRRRG